jgi:hypothetical protein
LGSSGLVSRLGGGGGRRGGGCCLGGGTARAWGDRT